MQILDFNQLFWLVGNVIYFWRTLNVVSTVDMSDFIGTPKCHKTLIHS